MTGHEPLQKLRRTGRKPACVWVMDDDAPISRSMANDWHTEANPFDSKVHAHIAINPDDIPEALDFRCLVGMTVHMECNRGKDRAKRLFDALVAAGPKVVMAVQGGDVWVKHGENHG